MSAPIVIVEGLGKRYRLGGVAPTERYTALRDVVAERAKLLFRRTNNSLRSSRSSEEVRDFWALKDVSFEFQQGEVVGIIGRNGAGKSTLLKVLSRITEPTEGKITIRGRVASLLEVGTGFHPELTGRENIFLNGAILGMHRYEIKAKFDEIVAFAEVEKFLDTPVKRYSSGMYVRLAFAVAAHLEPEVLIVDEVLAVGDAEFQKKCLGKMHEVSRGGRTVLFVSHNMAAIASLCTKGLLLRNGRLSFAGKAEAAIAAYLQPTNAAPSDRPLRRLSKNLVLATLECAPVMLLQFRTLRILIEIVAEHSEVIVDFALEIFALGGARIAVLDLRSEEGPYRLEENEKLTIELALEDIALVEGDFNVGLYLYANTGPVLSPHLCTFAVLPAVSYGGVIPREPQFRGFVELRPRQSHHVSTMSQRRSEDGPRLAQT